MRMFLDGGRAEEQWWFVLPVDDGVISSLRRKQVPVWSFFGDTVALVHDSFMHLSIYVQHRPPGIIHCTCPSIVFVVVVVVAFGMVEQL
jgi:hypothetical protein